MIDHIDKHFVSIIVDVCDVLSRNQVKHVTMGALLRLIGYDSDSAMEYDNNWLDLDPAFIAFARDYISTSHSNATIH
jgi:hypothetical protein